MNCFFLNFKITANYFSYQLFLKADLNVQYLHICTALLLSAFTFHLFWTCINMLRVHDASVWPIEEYCTLHNCPPNAWIGPKEEYTRFYVRVIL